jgi:ATP-binding cassette, subfamily B, bacterial RamB/AmfA
MTRARRDRGGLAVQARRMLIRSLRSHRGDVAWLAAWSLLEALPVLASGWAVAEAVSAFLAGHSVLGLAWLGLLAVAALTGGLATQRAYLRLGNLVESLRDELVTITVTGALHRSMSAAQRPDSDAVARITHQTEIVRDTYAGLLTVIRMFVFTMGSTVAGLLTLIPAALPYVIPPLLGSVLVLRLTLRPFAARQRRSVLGEEAVAHCSSRAVGGLRDVAACGAEAHVLAGMDAAIDAQAAATVSVTRVNAARQQGMAAGAWLPLLLLLFAAPSLLRGGVTPAQLIGAVTYIGGALRGAVSTLGQGIGGSAVQLMITLERIIEASVQPARTPTEPRAVPAVPAQGAPLVSASAEPGADPAVPPQPAPATSPRPVRARSAAIPGNGLPPQPETHDHKLGSAAGTCASGDAGRLEVRDLWFGYGASAEPVIRGLSLGIPPGDHLAVVGPSGIGKSSLAGLLAGMLVPTTGTVCLDGMPVGQVPAEVLPSRRVLLPQEAYVFAGTLAENIGYLAPGATESGLAAAAAAVGLDPVLARVGGFHAEVSAAALSAGECQLIALTRAYLSPAPIAILDEAACHLDPAAEARAELAFARRPGTLIVIAHRMSSALRAKRVLLLDGTGAELGDHAALLARSPLYGDLVGYWNEACLPTGNGPATPGTARTRGPAAQGEGPGTETLVPGTETLVPRAKR